MNLNPIKTRIVILDRASGKKASWKTRTRVTESTVEAFSSSLLSAPYPQRFHYDDGRKTLTVTLAQVDDWDEIKTLVPAVLLESGIKAAPQMTWHQRLRQIARVTGKIFNTTISGIDAAWHYAAPKIDSFNVWVAPRIIRVTRKLTAVLKASINA